MSGESVTYADVRAAVAALAEHAAIMSDECMRATARAERAEAEIDELVVALADLLLAVDAKSWSEIDAAVRDANRAVLGARALQVVR